jgi:hypothetical protein
MAKKEGMLDEQEANPITWSLFQKILQWWALDRKNIYLWVFSILQWNCMACSINIGVLALHCFRVGEDAIIVRYDKSMADQTGEKVSDKHVYDNIFYPLVSGFLALGVWFCLESARFQYTESLFQEDEKEDDAASQRYCSQLTELFKTYHDKLVQFIRADHANDNTNIEASHSVGELGMLKTSLVNLMSYSVAPVTWSSDDTIVGYNLSL